MRHVAIIISEASPADGAPDFPQGGSVWLDTLRRSLKERVDGQRQVLMGFDNTALVEQLIASHAADPDAHKELRVAALEVRDSLVAGGAQGLDDQVKTEGGTLVFTKGVLTAVKRAASHVAG